jgi:hypothetical protein
VIVRHFFLGEKRRAWVLSARTNKEVIFPWIKVLIGIFVFAVALSGIQTFGNFYRALPALLLAPMVVAVESENWGAAFTYS